MRLLIVCGIIGPVLRLGLIVVLGLLHPSYSQSRDFISELGAPDSPYAAVMNLLGIGAVGVLLMVFSFAFRRVLASDRLLAAGTWLLFLSGAAFVAVGLFPCDQEGCATDRGSSAMLAHVMFGFIAMTSQALAPLAIGLRSFRRIGNKGYHVMSLTLGIVSVAGLVLLVAGATAPGLAQKTMQVAADMWVLLSAVYLYNRPRVAAAHHQGAVAPLSR